MQSICSISDKLPQIIVSVSTNKKSPPIRLRTDVFIHLERSTGLSFAGTVRSQTYEEVELVVVDDASSDGTREWAESQNFIYIYIPQSESRGGNYARNRSEGSHRTFPLALRFPFLPEPWMWYIRQLCQKLGNQGGHGILYRIS